MARSEHEYEKVKEWGGGSLILRGGQTALHTIRMAGQVIKYVVGFYVLCGIAFVSWGITQMPKNEKQVLMQTQIVRLQQSIYPNDLDKPANFIQTTLVGDVLEESTLELTLETYEDHPIIQGHYQRAITKVKNWTIWSAIGVIIASIISIFAFLGVGKRIIKTQHFRGAKVITKLKLKDLVIEKNKELKKIMPRENYTPYQIGGVPYIYGTENQHTLICGKTGAGKSQEIFKIIDQIRYYKDRAVIFDYMGAYMETHYNPETDFLLNPMDIRCVAWDFFKDANTKEHFHTVAATMIAEGKDPYWSNSARTVFSCAAEKYYAQACETAQGPDLRTFLDLILKSKTSTLAEYLGDTEANGLFGKGGTTGSIMATLTTAMSSLYTVIDFEHEASTPFSISEWIQSSDEKGFLFIATKSDEHESLKPLISLWNDIAIRSLVSGKRRPDGRIWFVLDELPALAKLPSLIPGLTQGRQYGAAYLLGVQQKSQLEAIYDRHDTATLFGNCATKMMFSVNDPDTAEYLSKTIGRAHTAARDENISYGAETVRDGRNIMTRREKEFVILPEQIVSLPNLSAYLTLTGEMPVARVDTQYISWPELNSRYEPAPRKRKKFTRGLKETLDQLQEDIKGEETEAGIIANADQIVTAEPKLKKKKKKKKSHKHKTANAPVFMPPPMLPRGRTDEFDDTAMALVTRNKKRIKGFTPTTPKPSPSADIKPEIPSPPAPLDEDADDNTGARNQYLDRAAQEKLAAEKLEKKRKRKKKKEKNQKKIKRKLLAKEEAAQEAYDTQQTPNHAPEAGLIHTFEDFHR